MDVTVSLNNWKERGQKQNIKELEWEVKELNYMIIDILRIVSKIL